MDDEIAAQRQVVAAAKDHVIVAGQEVKAEQAAARAATDYADALAEVRKEVATITEETGAEIRAAQELGVSLEELSKKYDLSTDALRIYLNAMDPTPVTKFGEAVGDAAAEIEPLTNRVDALAEKFRGLHAQPTLDALEVLYRYQGPVIREALQVVGASVGGVSHRFMQFATMVPPAIASAGASIQGTAAETQSAWSRLGESFADFGAQISQTFARALEGGGGFLGATQSLGVQAGANLGNFLSKGLGTKMAAKTGFLTKGLGKVLGDAAGMAIPLIGPVIGQLVGQPFSLGGPSKAELAGRKTAGAFRYSVMQTLTDGQLAEASKAALGAWRGNEQGAQFLIGVRDAYLAVGRSAAEAESAVTRLWRAETRGPEAVAAVPPCSASCKGYWTRRTRSPRRNARSPRGTGRSPRGCRALSRPATRPSTQRRSSRTSTNCRHSGS